MKTYEICSKCANKRVTSEQQTKEQNESCTTTLRATTDKAIAFGIKFGGIEGAHHKEWVIDQMLRILAGDKYNEIIKKACEGEDGPDTYYWECGVAP